MIHRVPADLPDLAAALARAVDGDVVEIAGEVVGGVTVRAAVTLRAAPGGGTVVGGGLRALIVDGDATVDGIGVKNPGGHGLRVDGGSPRIVGVAAAVAETAFVAAGASTPTFERCVATACNNGMLVLDDAAPVVEGLAVAARGGGLVLRGRSRGRYRDLALRAGRFAALEAYDDADPERVESVAASSVEAGGLYLHGQSRGTWIGVRVTAAVLPGLEVAEQAAPELEDVEVGGCVAAAVRVIGGARVEILGLRAEGALGLDVGDDADVTIEDGAVRGATGPGLRVTHAATVELVRCEVSGAGGRVVLESEAAVVRER